MTEVSFFKFHITTSIRESLISAHYKFNSMKRLFTLFTIVSLTHMIASAQCVETPKNRVLLVGDSWAAFMNADGTINDGLRNIGHSDKRFVSNVQIAENGAETWDFVDGPKQDAIQNIINANPDVDIVHLSIGGNDVLGDWNISFTQQETDSLEVAVAARLAIIVDFLKSTKEGMRIFWPGYCYPNFEEVIEEIAPFQTTHPFYGTWNDMGQPNFSQLNHILIDFSDSVASYASNEPQLDFVPAQGILQHVYGQTQPLGVAPGGTYQPFEAPLPLGYPDYPSPKSSMRLYAGIFTDCFHLSEEAYLTLFEYQALKFYHKFLMDDLYILSSGGSADGSVSSAGDVSNEIRIGEENSNEVAAVLTFDTQQMADTTLAGASIFLRRSSLTGNSPFAGTEVNVKMKSGTFGTSADVEAVDYAEAGDSEGNPCRFGSHAKDGHWVRLDLTAEMIANIGNSDVTQFVISIPGFSGGLMTFSDASDPETAPVLNLKYGPEPQSVAEIRNARELPVYPIPTNGPLTIGVDANKLIGIEVLNILGEVVMQPVSLNSTIDISELRSGSYILRITSEDGISTKRVIKH